MRRENALPSTSLRVIAPARLPCAYQVVASLGSPSLFSFPFVLTTQRQSIAVIEMSIPMMAELARVIDLASEKSWPGPAIYAVYGKLLFFTHLSLIQKDESHGHAQ